MGAFEPEELLNSIMRLRSPKILPKWNILMSQVFQQADTDCNGSVTKSEWKSIIQFPSVTEKFEKCGLPRHILDGLFATIDSDRSNDLTMAEMVGGIEKLLAQMAEDDPGRSEADKTSNRKATRKSAPTKRQQTRGTLRRKPTGKLTSERPQSARGNSLSFFDEIDSGEDEVPSHPPSSP